MADSGEMKTIVEVETASPPPPAVKRARRCVQSKLSWLVPQAEEGEREDPSESEEEREGKKKHRRKSRTPKKSLVTNNDARGLNRGKNLHEKNKKEQHGAVPLKAGIGKCSIAAESKASSKNCRQVKNKKMPPKMVATPKKRTPKNVATPFKEPNLEQRLADKSCAKKNLFGQNLHTSLPLLDLRLEAKIAAEENVRLSAGKQIHPFFTCSKAAKRVSEGQDLTKVETRWSVLDGDFLDSSTPIHVFDTLGDDVASLNWRNWVFLDRTSQDLNGYQALESTLSVFKGSVEPLKLDTVSCVGMNLSKLSNGVLHALPDGEDRKEKVHVSMGDSFSSRCASNVGNLDNDQQDNLFNERLASYYQRCSYSPRCSLWTSKYQPENALEVCGNKESITSLNLWLKSWHERVVENSKGFAYGDKNATVDGEDSLYEIESDMEEIDDNAILKNVLLITGPIGSGKSASIYACAKEQGFEIIEVNASDVRNGSLIKHKYGEAMESHGFNRWSSEDPIGPRRKNILELVSSSPETAEGREIEYDSPEMISRACNQDSVPAECSLDVMESTAVSSQVANKSLILFEDVDTVFDEDRGFISSILQLADTAKRPIILTSNNKNPVLPHVLDRSVLDFTLPSPSELLPHLHLICASEKALVSYQLLERLVKLCLGDIRKTLLLLQFWCQGNEGTERKMQFTYSPLPCDVEAAHWVMPRLIPWEFKCELSKKVEEEISKTISALEEKSRFMESTELIGVLNVGNGVASHLTCKKNRRLKRNHAMLDQSEVSAHVLDLEDFSDVQESPVKRARQAVKLRPGRILCSQSEDDDLPPAENSEEIIDPVYKSLGDDVAQNHFENLETSPSHICDTFQLQDLSCVPESSFISVAETVNEVSSNNMSATFADFIKLIHVAPGVGFLDRAIVESSACSLHGNEEQGDFQNEDIELPANAFHLLDECSRVDFSMRLVPGKNSIYTPEVESVQETWRKLRDVREGLKPYLTSNLRDACSILKLASSLADLVSETDIMLDACTPLISDILEPSRTPFVEPDAFSWYEEQLEMGSTYAQHGLRFYTNKCSIIRSNLGYENTLNLSQEMLASSNNTMALGKLLTHGNSLRQDSHIHGDLNRDEPGCGISSGRGLGSELYNAVLPVVPKRTSMTLRGPAFHDYLSFMSQISKSEYSRLSESTNNNHRRRSRGSKHYLSSGSVQLSPEHLELLARQFS